MLLDLLQSLFNKLGIIVLAAFFLSRSNFMKGYLTKEKMSLFDKVIFSLIFGLVGIIGTYSGIPVNGAIANSRSVGVIVAGIFGGPAVGISAGLIAGIHRMLIPTGRFTAIACGLSTIIGGAIAGYAKPFIHRQKKKWITGAFLTIFIEAIQMLMILLIARPFDDAMQLVQIIFLPMAFINSFGTGIFILLIEQISRENELTAAAKASLVLKIASKTLPILRKGLNDRSAQEVCQIIYDSSSMDAVSITNKTKILAHIGVGSDHHLQGRNIHTRTTLDALALGKPIIAGSKEDIECGNDSCKLQSAVVIPLKMKDMIIGTLKLYKTSANSITLSDIEMAKGLASLFSTQVELSQITYQEEMATKSELKALQAQIQPHFLFNALNTIISFCRTDALKARDLLTKLSVYLRTSFQTGDAFVPLEKELEHVKNYLDIEEARFSNRLEVKYDIEQGINCHVPPLILQPLVENSLKHGLANKTADGVICVTVKQLADFVSITVCDNGCGIDKEKLDDLLDTTSQNSGVGLQNVISRIHFIYDTEVSITSTLEKGTVITILLPNDKLLLGGSK